MYAIHNAVPPPPCFAVGDKFYWFCTRTLLLVKPRNSYLIIRAQNFPDIPAAPLILLKVSQQPPWLVSFMSCCQFWRDILFMMMSQHHSILSTWWPSRCSRVYLMFCRLLATRSCTCFVRCLASADGWSVEDDRKFLQKQLICTCSSLGLLSWWQVKFFQSEK